MTDLIRTELDISKLSLLLRTLVRYISFKQSKNEPCLVVCPSSDSAKRCAEIAVNIEMSKGEQSPILYVVDGNLETALSAKDVGKNKISYYREVLRLSGKYAEKSVKVTREYEKGMSTICVASFSELSRLFNREENISLNDSDGRPFRRVIVYCPYSLKKPINAKREFLRKCSESNIPVTWCCSEVESYIVKKLLWLGKIGRAFGFTESFWEEAINANKDKIEGYASISSTIGHGKLEFLQSEGSPSHFPEIRPRLKEMQKEMKILSRLDGKSVGLACLAKHYNRIERYAALMKSSSIPVYEIPGKNKFVSLQFLLTEIKEDADARTINDLKNLVYVERFFSMMDECIRLLISQFYVTKKYEATKAAIASGDAPLVVFFENEIEPSKTYYSTSNIRFSGSEFKIRGPAIVTGINGYANFIETLRTMDIRQVKLIGWDEDLKLFQRISAGYAELHILLKEHVKEEGKIIEAQK